MDNSLKTKDLHHTAAERTSEPTTKPHPNPRIASAERRVKPLARLLRCATALRVTAAARLRLKASWYGRKVPFRPVHTARMPRFGAWCNTIERYQMRYKITR